MLDMTNTHPYDGINFIPPAAALKVDVENKITGQTLDDKVLALIDSGADLTNIPATVAMSLGLQPIDFIEVGDYSGKSHGDKPVYEVRVIIDAISFDVDAAETEGEFLIGRDLINNVKLTLDGPRFEFTL